MHTSVWQSTCLRNRLSLPSSLLHAIYSHLLHVFPRLHRPQAMRRRVCEGLYKAFPQTLESKTVTFYERL